MMTLSRVYGFWKYVTDLERAETRRYLEMFYGLQYRFRQLPLRRHRRRLAGVDLARRQFPQPTARHMAILTQQAHPTVVIHGHRGGAAGVADHLEFRMAPRRQPDALDADIDDLTPKYGATCNRVRAIVCHGCESSLRDPSRPVRSPEDRAADRRPGPRVDRWIPVTQYAPSESISRRRSQEWRGSLAQRHPMAS
jgi:hypothetical protein